MPFSKPLPTWNAVGTEPPQSKKDSGWGPNEKPPADWFNWIWNTTYQAMKEMQENAVHTDRIGQTIAQLVSGRVPVTQLPDGTTSAKGIVQLSSATNSTSTTLAATASAVKAAYDLANGKYTKPAAGIPKSDLDSSVQTSLSKADAAETDLKNHKGSGGTAHAVATTESAGFMSNDDKSKLNGIAANANNYEHPANHPASIIAQDTNNRFVTDAEKATWNAKASTAATQWLQMVYQNAWVNYGSALGEYTKDEFGFVHFRAFIKSGTVASGTIIFTLPVGFRPNRNEYISTVCLNGTNLQTCSIVVSVDGTVICDRNVANTWLSLNNFTFKAEN
jgi:hypothetical protein